MRNYGIYICNFILVAACATGAIMYRESLPESLGLGALGLIAGASTFIPDRRKPSKLENQQH